MNDMYSVESLSDSDALMKLDSLYGYLEYLTAKYPDHVCVSEYSDGRTAPRTYRELLGGVRNFGDYLIAEGVRNKHISIIGGFCYEWLISFFAAAYSGNAIVPADADQPGERIISLLREGNAELAIAQKNPPGSAEKPFGGIRAISFDEVKSIASGASAAPHSIGLTRNDPIRNETAMIVYTSGTTGKSKGVMLSHRNILHDVIGTAAIIGEHTFSPGDTTIVVLPLFHMYGITGLLITLYYGAVLCYSKNTIKDIEALLGAYKPKGLIVVPQIVEGLHKKIWASAKRIKRQNELSFFLKVSRFLRIWNIDMRKLIFKRVLAPFGGGFILICGGAAIDGKIVEEMNEFGFKVLVGYGITECSPIVSVNPPGRQKPGSVGVPLQAPLCGVKAEDGEIMVRGSIVMAGYYNNPEETASAFGGDSWFKTGDLGVVDEDGFLYITGRKKNLIILSDGNNISPEELEARISQSPAVDSVMVGEKAAGPVSVLSASVYPDYAYCRDNGVSDVRREIEKLIRQVNGENPKYMKISDIVIKDAPFEKTATGKIKRHA